MQLNDRDKSTGCLFLQSWTIFISWISFDSRICLNGCNSFKRKFIVLTVATCTVSMILGSKSKFSHGINICARAHVWILYVYPLLFRFFFCLWYFFIEASCSSRDRPMHVHTFIRHSVMNIFDRQSIVTLCLNISNFFWRLIRASGSFFILIFFFSCIKISQEVKCG